MTTERFSNQASTALSSAIGAGDLSISVQSATHFPGQPEFRVRVGQELMLVTGVAGATWTVTRGIEGTTAASHAIGTVVVAVLTAGGIDELRTEIEAEIPQNTVQTTDPRLSDDRTASGIRSATTVVSVSSATAPNEGQVLTATSSTAADWEYDPNFYKPCQYTVVNSSTWNPASFVPADVGATTVVAGDRILQPGGSAPGPYVATSATTATLSNTGADAVVLNKRVNVGSATYIQTAATGAGTAVFAPISRTLTTSVDVDLITASNDVVTAYTLPATPTGAGRWVLRRALARVKVIPTGTGTPSNTFRLGSTSGGQEILLDFVVDSTATVGLISAGQALLSLGADMVAANGFEAVYAAGQAFYIKRTKGGTTVTGGAITLYLYFDGLP